ncbi:MAG TPA: alkaline phosphatase family protein [Thermoanaerobaculia bacterium]
MSFDGMGADALARQSGLPAFDRIAREGSVARVIPVEPTLTSTTHASILTGAPPERTGIVSNRFHLPGTPSTRTTRGLEVDTDVETIVEAARRQGKRVGAVSFPSVDGGSPRRTADFGLAWTPPLTSARIIELTRADFHREWVPPGWSRRPLRRTSFSPVMRARIDWQATSTLRADVDIVAYDTTNDGVENYDSLFVEVDSEEIGLDPRGWFAVSKRSNGLYGSWSKLTRTSPGLDTTIYWGAISRSNAWPDYFREMLDDTAGFWPGAPESSIAIDIDTFREQVERFATFYTVAQAMSIRRMSFDLLLLYQPQIDEATHALLGNPAGESTIRASWEAADRAIASFLPLLDPARDALLVTGDHGLLQANRELRINRLLEEQGFAPRWRAFTAGNLAHIYRFGDPDDREAVFEMLAKSGHFERIERKGSGHHHHSGDLIAWAPAHVATSASSEPPVLIDRQPFGLHGANVAHRELHTTLIAWGAGTRPGQYADLPQTRIARFVSTLLGISPPAGAE